MSKAPMFLPEQWIEEEGTPTPATILNHESYTSISRLAARAGTSSLVAAFIVDDIIAGVLS
jgi:hypothetical protein